MSGKGRRNDEPNTITATSNHLKSHLTKTRWKAPPPCIWRQWDGLPALCDAGQ